MSRAERDHAALLNEIMRRLRSEQATEGWVCEPYGDVYDDAWGAAQWVAVQPPGDKLDYLLVTVVRQ